MQALTTGILPGARCLGGDRVRFCVWAPFADSAAIHLVAPQKSSVPLQAVGDGYYGGTAEGVAPGSRYFIALGKAGRNGQNHVQRWPDPASRCQPEGVHGPSQVVDEAFKWQADNWQGLCLSRYVISEIHVGTFTPAGTLDAVIGELDRLRDSGFTALELMPVAQFPGRRNWGYDGVYPFAVQNSYGGPLALKRLVDACHQRKMALILDVVYNHLGPEGNYLEQFGPYFTDFYRTLWGRAVNFDGPESDPVRRFFIENALQWVREFKIDALRLDAVHAIYDFSARPFLKELAGAVHTTAEMQDRRIYCIAESALNDANIVRTRKENGLGLDAQWNDDFHHALHTLLTGENQGYYQDFGRLADLAKAWKEGFVYSGGYSRFRRRRHGNSSGDIPGRRLVVYSQNHDQVGNRMQGERLSTLISFEQQKLAAAQVLLAPYIPLFFMGEEYGEKAPFPYFVSHSDPALVEAVRKGRAAEFAGFQWEGTPPDPQDENTFFMARPDPSLAGGGRHKILLAFHKNLLRLRRRIGCLHRLRKTDMQVQHLEAGRVLLVRRRGPADEVCAVFHFGAAVLDCALPLPAGCWSKWLDSADTKWSGPGSMLAVHVAAHRGVSIKLALTAHSAVVFGRSIDQGPAH